MVRLPLRSRAEYLAQVDLAYVPRTARAAEVCNAKFEPRARESTVAPPSNTSV